MKRIATAIVLCLALAACGGKKKADEAPEQDDEIECDTKADCEDGMQCLGNECVDTSSKAIYTNPSNAVTPEKVKREVERRQKVHTDKVDKSLEL